MKELHLDQLKNGLPGITKAIGAFLAEAAAYCLEAQGHQSGVVLNVFGNFEEEFSLCWTDVVDEPVKKAWADEKEATEYAATGIAILLILDLTDFLLARRLRQGDRADYFLVKKSNPKAIVSKALLEISGIFEETPSNTINMRLGVKKANLNKISNRDKPAFIIIVAFQVPKVKITIYE